jgi:hypothetical protein
MRGRKGRGGVACLISVLLHVGGEGNGSVVANGATVTARQCRVNTNISQAFLELPSRSFAQHPSIFSDRYRGNPSAKCYRIVTRTWQTTWGSKATPSASASTELN